MSNYKKGRKALKPLISIIIPVYNGEKYIKQCVESVLNQTYSPIEIIIINDGSTDSTSVILEEIALKNSCIKYILKENSGVSNTRNIGLSMVKGYYIYFLDSDDWIDVNTLELLYEQFQANNQIDFVVSGLYLEYENRTKVIQTNNCIMDRNKALISLFNNGYIRPVVWGKLIKTSLLHKNNITFDQDIYYSEDVKFVVEMLTKSKQIAIITEPLYHYILNNNESAMKSIGQKDSFNEKWLSKWIAYERMEQILNKLLVNRKVLDEFVSSKVEVAKDTSSLLIRYKISNKELTNCLRQYIRRNLIKYLTTRKTSCYRKIYTCLYSVFPNFACKVKKST